MPHWRSRWVAAPVAALVVAPASIASIASGSSSNWGRMACNHGPFSRDPNLWISFSVKADGLMVDFAKDKSISFAFKC